MQVELKRINENCHFKAVGSAGVEVNIDGAPSIGGQNAGARPMELILMGLGGCTAMDVISILKKQKQKIDDLKITIDGERLVGQIPSIFKTINVHYIFKGELEEKKVKHAIELSMEKYCSVTAILNKTAKIDYSFSIEI